MCPNGKIGIVIIGEKYRCPSARQVGVAIDKARVASTESDRTIRLLGLLFEPRPTKHDQIACCSIWCFRPRPITPLAVVSDRTAPFGNEKAGRLLFLYPIRANHITFEFERTGTVKNNKRPLHGNRQSPIICLN